MLLCQQYIIMKIPRICTRGSLCNYITRARFTNVLFKLEYKYEILKKAYRITSYIVPRV
jgi:hypothetical protein